MLAIESRENMTVSVAILRPALCLSGMRNAKIYGRIIEYVTSQPSSALNWSSEPTWLRLEELKFETKKYLYIKLIEHIYVILWVWDIDQVKLNFNVGTDTNVYYGYLFTASKVGYLFFNINFYWCYLLIHAVNMIIVRSV